MIVYHASKKGFIEDVFNGRIADEIDHAFVTLLTSSTCHPKFFVEQRGDALMAFHEHGSTDVFLILRQCHLDGNYSLSQSQPRVDTHVYMG